MNRPFHDIGSVFPGEFNVRAIKPGVPVLEAVRIMLETRYSQLPVVEDGTVRGVFSLWTLAQHLASCPQVPLSEVAVEDAMGQLPHVTVNDSIDDVLDRLEKHEALLVMSPRGLQAVATHSDLLRFYAAITKPFVLIREIELAIRNILEACLPDGRVRECIADAVQHKYDAARTKIPAMPAELTFDDYRAVICHKRNWQYFAAVLGRNRRLVSSKLSRVGEIRNKAFHFKGEISVVELETLVAMRNWLFDKFQHLGRMGRDDG